MKYTHFFFIHISIIPFLSLNMLYVFAISIQKNPECKYIQDKEVTGGFEPPMEVLQTCALPLGYVTKDNITKYDKFHNTISK